MYHLCFLYFECLLLGAYTLKIFLGICNILLSVQLLRHVGLYDPVDCSTPGFPVHHQFPELAELMSIKLEMPSNHLNLCHLLLLLPSIFPSIRVFPKESVLCIRWPKYWSFSFSISPSNEYSGLISFRIDWFDLFAVQYKSKELSRVFFNITVQKHQLFGAQLSLWPNLHIDTGLLEKLKLWVDRPLLANICQQIFFFILDNIPYCEVYIV